MALASLLTFILPVCVVVTVSIMPSLNLVLPLLLLLCQLSQNIFSFHLVFCHDSLFSSQQCLDCFFFIPEYIIILLKSKTIIKKPLTLFSNIIENINFQYSLVQFFTVSFTFSYFLSYSSPNQTTELCFYQDLFLLICYTALSSFYLRLKPNSVSFYYGPENPLD